MRAATIKTGESSTHDGHDIGRLIVLVGKGGGFKSYVFYDTPPTLFQRHVWSISIIMVFSTTGKADFLINT